MSFLWPELLWALLVLPFLILGYLWILRRKRRAADRYASLSLMRTAMVGTTRFRRHIPPLLLFAALTTMILGLARPAAVVPVPRHHETVILAMDVSGSMRAKDMQPDRITAAQEAAKAFVNDQPRGTRIGVVAFAGAAAVVQSPTASKEDVLAAIDRFQLQRGTAIGSGIIVSLATLFPEAGITLESVPSGKMGGGRGEAQAANRERDWWANKPREAWKPVPPGSNASSAIVLLSDGQSNTGPKIDEAAKLAADHGVRIYTVGVGTVKGEILGSEGWSMRVKLDEDALKSIANVTYGEYLHAASAPELKKVYQALSAKLMFEKKASEISAIFSAVAAALALLAAFLSMTWFHRVV